MEGRPTGGFHSDSIVVDAYTSADKRSGAQYVRAMNRPNAITLIAMVWVIAILSLYLIQFRNLVDPVLAAMGLA